MALADVSKCCLDSIRQISEQIDGAIVYLDAGCTESFQFTGAFPLLLECGARAVCSLENVSELDGVVDWNSNFDTVRKIVVITSRLLSDAHRYILRCLSAHQTVCMCTVFTSISEVAHSAYPDSPLGPDAFHEYESLLVQDYQEIVKKSEKLPHSEPRSNFRELFEDGPTGNIENTKPELAVSVQHFPVILCPFSPRIFVLPSEGAVAEGYLSMKNEDSISSGLPPITMRSSFDGDDVPPGATLTAHFLYHLANKMDLKLEIFSLGDLSKAVGKMMTDMSSLYDVGRRTRTAGLLLIDRSLDLLTPCCHGDSLLDRMFSSLPRRERCISYTNLKSSQTQPSRPSKLQRAPLDVQIPVGEILEEDISTQNKCGLVNIESFLHGWESASPAVHTVNLTDLGAKVNDGRTPLCRNELLHGSFVSDQNFRGTRYLEAILDRKTKEGATLVNKFLQETLRRENLPANLKTRHGIASKSELQPLIKALMKSQSSLLRNKGVIQLATAMLFALDEVNSSHWEAFISAEKMLRVSSEDTSQSLAAQMGDIINKTAFLRPKEQKDEHPQGLLSFEDALLLTVTGYILAGESFPTSSLDGPFSWQEEQFLKEAIVEAVLENPSASKLKFLHGLKEELEANFNSTHSVCTRENSPRGLEIDDFDDDHWGKWGDEDEDDSKNKVYDNMQLKLELRDRVDFLFKFLHKLSGLRRKNIQLRDDMFQDSNFNGPDGKGLLLKLLTRLLGKYDLPGLEYHSSTVGRLFKSGFRRFGLGQAKPNLADHDVIMVFILGGISGIEIQEAQEALSESGRPDIELILGGTTLLTPDDMFELLIGEHSHI